MRNLIVVFWLVLLSCDTGNLEVVMDIPSRLNEVSGVEINNDPDIIWMVNDGGNKPILYGLDHEGNIVKSLKVKANNRDWEDLTTDLEGNIYIGNFGNNANDRTNLSVLKILKTDLNSNEEIVPQIIEFSYPDQNEFPPKNKPWHFDCESFFYYNDSLYLFTKSRTSRDLGKTNLYKLPAKSGSYKAEYIGSFSTCSRHGCWVTSADINAQGNEMVLLTEHSAFVFSGFKSDNFFSGQVDQFPFDHFSQKESVCYLDDNTLLIADERSAGKGGLLYTFSIPRN